MPLIMQGKSLFTMGELNFNNFDFSKLRAGMNIGNDNIFLKKYDKDGNSIFDAEEMSAFKQDLENYAGDDKKLNKNEALTLFSRVMNVTLDKAKEIFTQQGNIVANSFNYIVTQDAKEDSIEAMQTESKTAMELYNKAVGGDFSKMANSLKELFNTEYAGDKVYRQIAAKTVTTQLLTRTKNGGISKKDYIETKISLLKGLLGNDELPDNQKQLIESEIPKLTIREIDTLIVRLTNAENNDYPKIVDEVIKDFAANNSKPADVGGSFRVSNPNSVEMILNTAQAEDVLTFEQIYLMETGVEFNPENIQNYERQTQITNAITMLNNQVVTIKEALDEPTKNLENLNKNSGTPEQLEFAYKTLSDSVLNTLKKMYGDNPEKLAEILKKYGGKNAELKDGVIDFGAKGINYTALVELSQNIKKTMTDKLDNALGGKTLEQYGLDLKFAYEEAYGAKNTIDIAEKFQQSQAEGVGYIKMGANLGVALLFASGGSLVAMGAGIAASLGTSSYISSWEATSKSGGITEEDKAFILEELKQTMKFFPAGMAVGAASAKFGAELLKTCPKLVAKVGEYGSDFALSLLSTYALTGELDISGEGIAEIINVLQGVIAHNKISKLGAIDHPTSSRTQTDETMPPRNNTENTTSTASISRIEASSIPLDKKAHKEFNKLLKKLDRGGLTKEDAKLLREQFENNPQLAAAYSKLAEQINVSGGNLQSLKTMMDFAQKRGITDPNELNELFSTLINTVGEPKRYFDMQHYGGGTLLGDILKNISEKSSIEDYCKFIERVFKDSEEIKPISIYLLSREYKNIDLDKALQIMDKYADDPMLLPFLDPMANISFVKFLADSDDVEKTIAKMRVIRENLGLEPYMQKSEIEENLAPIIQLTDAEFDNLVKRGLWKKYIGGLDLELAKLDDETFANFEKRGLALNSSEISLALLSDAEWALVQKYGLNDGKLTSALIAHIAKNGEDYIHILQKRGLLNRHIDSFKEGAALDRLVSMTDEEFKIIQDRKLLEGYPTRTWPNGKVAQFDLNEIEMLAKLSNTEYKRAQELFHIPERGIEYGGCWGDDYRFAQFEISHIVELVKLPDSDWQFLQASGALKELRMDSIRTLLDYQALIGKNSLDELSTGEKQRVAKMMVKHNQALFNEDFQKFIVEKYGKNLIPTDQATYCATLSKLARESRLEVNKLKPQEIERYNNAINKLAESNGAFLRTNLEDPNFRMELEYPRDSFMSDVESALTGMSTAEKQKIMDYFGFEISQQNGKLVMSGYPMVIKDKKIPNDPAYKKVAELVERFTDNNKVKIKDNPELAATLNDVFDAFPELKAIIGKEQHGMHSYSLDVHTLKVLQGVMANPKYKSLSPNDQKALALATLLHDISKKEGLIDKQHPQNSAYDAYQLASKLGLSKDEQRQIYKLVKFHDWLEQYNKPGISTEERTKIAQMLAFELKDGNNYELAAMLTDADLKAVTRNGSFHNQFKDVYAQGVKEISALINKIKTSEIYMPQTRFPKASQLKADGKIVEERVINGRKVKVLHLKKGVDMNKYGFPEGTISDDITMFYHGFAEDSEKNLRLLDSLGDLDSDATLSVSLLGGSFSPEVYAPYGVILRASDGDIIAGTHWNFGSGRGEQKIISNVIDEYIYSDKNGAKGIRNDISNRIKKKFNLSDSEYVKFYDTIKGKSLTELEKLNPAVARGMREILAELEYDRVYNAKMTALGGKHISEYIVRQANVQAVTARGDVNQIPNYLLKYAEENDLVIVVQD